MTSEEAYWAGLSPDDFRDDKGTKETMKNVTIEILQHVDGRFWIRVNDRLAFEAGTKPNLAEAAKGCYRAMNCSFKDAVAALQDVWEKEPTILFTHPQLVRPNSY